MGACVLLQLGPVCVAPLVDQGVPMNATLVVECQKNASVNGLCPTLLYLASQDLNADSTALLVNLSPRFMPSSPTGGVRRTLLC